MVLGSGVLSATVTAATLPNARTALYESEGSALIWGPPGYSLFVSQPHGDLDLTNLD
ncbi:hypothetical protein DES52_11736 [Deinococcus yavapaiensis KR-236]|uniref:Uncharacterized protein n=1 Tax=Deinococcus yavapaiensis KR-236 TaxID=694435 RepID=A0A318SDN8_9DEIO|nr:hypothetical protein DES52_11736 [Deinococcus yavapaiensis KR-236]